MQRLFRFFLSLGLLMIVVSCQSQNRDITVADKQVGGPCEGCEAIFEYADKSLSPVDTLPGFEQYNPQLILSGTVYEADGERPAAGVILYIYQTNRNGIYATNGEEKGWAKRHGIHRGWVKTDDSGAYTFYTFRPAAYPNGEEVEHIHITVKPPGYTAYYIDEYVFDDDPRLTVEETEKLLKRGGSGICSPNMDGDQIIVHRDIYLGMNIPGYD